jgi:hypothetical protein
MITQVLFDGENVWTINGEPLHFDSFEDAAKELDEHFADMDEAGMDYEPADYRIEAFEGGPQ